MKSKISKSQPTPNKVLIRLAPPNDQFHLKSGLILYMDTDFHRGKHAVVRGTVMATSELQFDKTYLWSEFDVDMELEVGDDIIYDYKQYLDNTKFERVFKEGGERYMFIEHDHIYCAVRNKDLIMINGYILVEPDDKEKSSKIIHTLETGKSEKTGVIRHMGTLVKCYYSTKDPDPEGLSIGDRVVFRDLDATTLEYSDHVSLDEGKYYKMQRKDVIGIIDAD